jgi:YidC/Oxa1 family membrane protein insertase
MFTTFFTQPIFNILVFLYAILPGHNFGLAIILFTILIRLMLWPLVKKQLHQTKIMRKLQPELKQIKKDAKGDKQKEAAMTMELYKERGFNPFGSIGILLLQLPILIALYSGLNKVIHDPQQIISFAYPFLQDFSWMKHLASNIHLFDASLFGVVDLSKAALSKDGVYWPAMMLVLGSAVTQYFQSVQLMPQDKDARKLREILKEAGTGKQADQSEVNASIMRGTRFLLPAMIFLFTVNLASALSLYWLVGGLVAFIQQTIVLREDETEMEAIADEPSKNVKYIPEAEVVSEPSPKKPKKAAKKSSKKAKKRRR